MPRTLQDATHPAEDEVDKEEFMRVLGSYRNKMRTTEWKDSEEQVCQSTCVCMHTCT